MQRIRKLLFCALWALSAVTGFYFLFAPILPLIVINRKAYRRITDNLAAIWESCQASLLDIVSCVSVSVSGDPIRADETSLIVMNHRSAKLDPLFFLSAVHRATNPTCAQNTKIVLKEALMRIPVIGWMYQMSRHIGIVQNWKMDEERLGAGIDLSSSTSDPFQVLLFPEGGSLNAENRKKSEEYAKRGSLASYEHVLHPRTTGFGFIAERLRDNHKLDAVYDVTAVYPGAKGEHCPQDEKDLLEGKFPEKIHYHIRRFQSPQSVPTTVVGLEKWLQEIWRDKEQALDALYKQGIAQQAARKPIPLQYLSLASWTAFVYWSLSSLLLNLWGLLWLASVSALMCVVCNYTEGLPELEVLFDKHGTVKTLTTGAFFKRVEQKKKKNI